MHVARCKHRTQKIDKNSPSAHDRTIMYGSVFATKVSTNGKILKQQYVFHMSSQHGELRPTNGWDRLRSLQHHSKFQRVSLLAFVTAATSLTGGQPNIAGCLAVSYTFSGALTLWRNFARCKIHFTSKSCVLLYWQCCWTALQQRASARLCGVVKGMELLNFDTERHLSSPRRPSLWASAHILIIFCKAHYTKLVAWISP